MKLRTFDADKDFEKIRSWISDERSHAMWCANRFDYPLERNRFEKELSAMAQKTEDMPFAAINDNDGIVGFFCYSVNRAAREGRLKFVVVDPAYRGRGTAREMLHLAISYAFRETNAETVTLCVFPENISAKKCYEKVGFSEVKRERRAFVFQEEAWDRCRMITGRNDLEKTELSIKTTCTEEIMNQLEIQRKRYPLMNEEDIVKFVFQGMLGVGHLIRNSDEAKNRLSSEMASLEPEVSEPLAEKISTEWFRLNLRPAKAAGMSIDDLARSLIRSAEMGSRLFTRADVYDFCMKMDGSERMDSAAKKVLDESWLPSHSKQYREKYCPAYRVLYKDFVKFEKEEN